MRRPGMAAVGAACVATALWAACEDPAPPLEIEGTGSVAGLVFFDKNEDGIFDPSDGDAAVPGVDLVVRDRGTGDVLGPTETSGADGRFEIDGLPLGTHDLFVVESSVPDSVSICQNPIPVNVFKDESSFAEVRGRPACLITIAEAKELPLGSFVIVRGFVTSSPGQIETNWVFIQDGQLEDGGAGTRLIASALSGLGIEIGDRVEIGGVTGAFSNDFEIATDVVLRDLTEDVATLASDTVTTQELSDSGTDYKNPLQGALVTVVAAELVAAFGNAPGGNIQNGVIDDGSGTTIIRIDDGVADRNTLNDLMTVGACYDITGFGANFAGSGQIFPRSTEDIVEVTCN